MSDTPIKPAVAARRLVRSSDRATLATALGDDGWPYASLVMVACSHDASPLLLISELAEHTRNLASDPRASLLFDGTVGLDTPLTGLRATLLGPIERCDDPFALDRYVRRHPDAESYLALGDFHLHRMSVERARIVAGFGVIEWLSADKIVLDDGPHAELAASEADIIQHMNEDHAQSVTLYATGLLGLKGDGWKLTGIDPEGIDLGCEGIIARLNFDHPVSDDNMARKALVELVNKARATGQILR